MTSEPYTIRVMTRPEINLALEWAAREGWNPGLHDADPNGFLVGLRKGEPIAAISVVKYGEAFAFLGCYIVRPEFRGRGYGVPLWQAGMESLRGRTVGLDGVVAQQANYRKSGFQFAHRNIRYEGTGSGESSDSRDIVPLVSVPFAEITACDRLGFPVQRPAFLQRWITQPGARALGLVKEGRLAGYGVIRPCRIGLKIGPLFAEDLDTAERLFAELRAGIPTTTQVYLDVPEVNRLAVQLAERHGMRVVFETARMYAGEAPSLDWHRVFGVTSFELG